MFSTSPGGSESTLGQGGRGFEPQQWPNPSSDLLSISLLIRETVHIDNENEHWNTIFQDNMWQGNPDIKGCKIQ